MKIVGYTDVLSVAPGDPIRVMISSEAPQVSANLVRLIHGDHHPEGPGYKEVLTQSTLDGTYPARHQALVKGSYVRIPHSPHLDLRESMTVQLFMFPTLLDERGRTLISKGVRSQAGWAISLDPGGCVEFTVTGKDGLVHRLVTGKAVRVNNWYAVAARIDRATGTTSLEVDTLLTGPGSSHVLTSDTERVIGTLIADDLALCDGADLLIGARSLNASRQVSDVFDGKIGNPSVYGRALSDMEIGTINSGGSPTAVPGVVASWDFGRTIGSRHVVDVAQYGLHGRTVNLPTRGIPGPWWRNFAMDYREAPEQFAAIHFHEDDLDDAGWSPTIEWTVPDDVPSGVYAVRIREKDGTAEDCIPFFVRPPRGKATAKVLFLVPVFSYLAYANEHTLEAERTQQFLEAFGGHADYPHQPEDKYIVANQLHSLYDHHHDGSGVCYSSWLRPLLNMRPQYMAPALDLGNGSAHQLNADLHIIDWLHEKGVSYDVATEVDLHREGLDLLTRYQVVISGSHPEYVTRPVLEALHSYTNSGGRFMYLGGNGFYWVTGFDPEEQHTIEVRRCGASTRAWEMESGAWHLSTTGEFGGLWRMRALDPQSLVGTGFTAQGLGEGRPYTRQPDSYDPRAKFIFDGIDSDELIGDMPNLVNGYGAAGFEVDRAAFERGTPRHAMTLATASGFSDGFQHAVEDVLMSDSAQSGGISPLVRADMVFFECIGGGAVFSVSSIAWSGCLSHNNYENNVSKITENVLRRFMAPDPFELPMID